MKGGLGIVKTSRHHAPESPESAGLAFTFRALGSRNYRLFFAGQGISLIGTWMQQIAMIWLVYRLTHSPFLLGVVGFAGQIPTFLFAPFAGVLADRWNRHRTIVVTQTLSLLQAATLAVLVLTGTVEVWHLVVLAVILGAINAFDMPTRQSFIVQMIERKKDLANAIALNSAMVTATRLLGPSIAGILIGAFGEGICFLVNAISYVAVIAALLAMRVAPPPARPANGRMIDGLKEGFAYVAGFAPVRDILLLLALISFMGMPYHILMPVFAKDILGGGAHTLGFLMGASGLGALVGTIYLAMRKTIRGFGRIIAAAAMVFGVGLVAFSPRHLPAGRRALDSRPRLICCGLPRAAGTLRSPGPTPAASCPHSPIPSLPAVGSHTHAHDPASMRPRVVRRHTPLSRSQTRSVLSSLP